MQVPLLPSLVALALTSTTQAQVVWQDSFDAVGAASNDGPEGMLAAGYEFRTVVTGGGAPQAWRQGPWHAGQIAPHHGSGFLSTGLSVPPFSSVTVARWMILPPAVGASGGHEISLWVQGFTNGSLAPSLELRFSPTGGTSTGSAVADVGDFTLLLDDNEISSFSQWDQLVGTAPSTGRVALRWIGAVDFSVSGTSLQLNVDDAQVAATATVPPVPGPGETVHWTTAMSPVLLTTQVVVPAGGTLVIDAGVEVSIEFENTTFGGPEIWVNGELIADGTASAPVVFRAAPGLSRLPALSGNLTLRHAEVGVRVGGAAVDAESCSFARAMPVDWSSSTDAQWHTPGLFAGTFSSAAATARLVDCLFQNAVAELHECFPRIEGCTFDDARLTIGRYFPSSDVLVRGNTFRNLTETPPLVIDGWNADLRDNVFTNNLHPVQLSGGGLTPGSELPTSGNLDDRILVAGGLQVFRGDVTVPAMPVPYFVPYGGDLDYYPGHARLLAGARLQLGPGAYLGALGANTLLFRGEPENPVRVEAAQPGSPWITVRYGANRPPQKQEYFHMSGGTYGFGCADTLLHLRSGVLADNVEGLRSGDYGRAIVHDTVFERNDIGFHGILGGQGPSAIGLAIMDSEAMPNSFEANGAAAVVDAPYSNVTHARRNWWGHPSGPSSPQNPGGSGGSASHGVDVVPFRSSPPDFVDRPPRVRALRSDWSRIVRSGDKVILSWSVTDEGAIVAQRIERIPIGGYDWFTPQLLVSNIPPGARSVELTIQDWSAFGDPSPYLRIVAVDDQGQEGFDSFTFEISAAGTIDPVFVTDLSAGAVVGREFTLDWSGLDFATVNVSLFADDLHERWSRGSTIGELGAMSNEIPALSTDLARYGILNQGHWTFGPFFTIRPDARLGDEAPSVHVDWPAPGTPLAGGGVVPLRWTASDDGALRSFDVQVSANGGWTWFPIAEDLAPATRSLDFVLPSSNGIDDLRLRVIARDERFQASSSTCGPFAVAPGGWNVLDCNGNGTPDVVDLDHGTSMDENLDGVPDECATSPIAECFGDGSGAACPCGNESSAGAGAGCLNSLGTGGRLVASGVALLYADSLVLHGSGMTDSSALYFQGTQVQAGGIGAAFGDGLRCAGGAIVRLGVRVNSGGASRFPERDGIGIALRGAISSPGQRVYQVWYRNSAAFCTPAPFNLTNAVRVVWSI